VRYRRPAAILAACVAVAASAVAAGAGAPERAGSREQRAIGGGPGGGSSGPRATGLGSPSIARFVDARRFGRSGGGRALVTSAFGSVRAAENRVLVVACIHGTECAGAAVTRLIPRGCPPTHADVWTVPDLNPDGHRLGVRVNGRGVDLNRNFAAGWRPIGRRGDPEYSGPRPFSEPETRAARSLIARIRPAVTIWYHQGEGPYVRAWGPSVPAARRYARAAGLPFRAMPWLAGTGPQWQNRSFPGTSSFVVELPVGKLPAGSAQRHAAAVELLAGYRGVTRLGLRRSARGRN
jgi:protein MpaA